jgi:large conductance mechanosensitive channel
MRGHSTQEAEQRRPGDADRKSSDGRFREGLDRGNVVDLAVGVIVGGAFGKIVTALVNDLVMPFVALALPSGDWRTAGLVLRHGAEAKDDVVPRYGDFLATTIDFLVVAFALFLVVTKVVRAQGRGAESATTGASGAKR